MIDLNVHNEKTVLNEFMEECFYSILESERKALEPPTNGELTMKEIHLIAIVFKLQQIGENNFSRIANKLGITLGTLTTAFNKLEKKGYLKKEKYLIDNRVYYVTTTPLAEKVYTAHTKWHDELAETVFNVIPESDKANFVNAFKKLTEHFKQ